MKEFHAGKASERGFTLVELMIVVVIAAIVLGIAVPAARDVLVKNRMTSALNEFVAAVQAARSNAVKNNTIARICPSQDGLVCSTGGGAGWHQGWIVFIDYNDNGNVNGAVAGPPAFPADEIVLKGEAVQGMTFKSGLASAASLRFRPDGSSGLDCSTASNCMLRLCIRNEVQGDIRIDATGRPQAKRIDTVSDCP